MDLRSCFFSGLEARLARVDSGFTAVHLRPCLGSCVFKSCLLQPPLLSQHAAFHNLFLDHLLRPPGLLLGFCLPCLVQLADTSPLSLGVEWLTTSVDNVALQWAALRRAAILLCAA